MSKPWNAMCAVHKSHKLRYCPDKKEEMAALRKQDEENYKQQSAAQWSGAKSLERLLAGAQRIADNPKEAVLDDRVQ